jgi:phage head maturation protease
MNAHAPILTRAAPLSPSSWNAADRSFQVAFATETPVERRDARGVYFEVLSLSGMQLASSALPLLDSHARGSLASQIGSADHVRVLGGEALATVRLSRANPTADRVAVDLDAGQTFGVSTGFIINGAQETVRDGVRYVTATRWTVVEISLVPIPADPRTGIRGQFMTVETTPVPAPEPNQTAIADRAAVNSEIRAIARVAGLGQDFVDTQIDAAATVEAARAAAFEAMRARSTSTAGIRTTAVVGTDYTDPEVRARTIGEALFTRVAPSHTPSEAARAYVGLTIPEVARDCLRTRGIQTTGMSAARVVERAMQSTSDFPLLLADTVNRTLRQAYEAAPAGVKRLARETTARDFRAKNSLQFSTAPTLLPVNEHGEFKAGAMAEAKESYAVTTFGRIIGFTRQAMVNDDLGAFADVTRRMGQAAAAFEASFLANLVTSNPTMSDSVALFHASHGNLEIGSGVPDFDLTPETLSLLRKKMCLQTGLLGEAIAVTPKFILCGADRETQADKVVTAITPMTSSDVNPFASKLEVVVDPRISVAWYLVADPAEIDGLEYAYLEGNAGPQITSELGFDVDGIRFRVRLDFGAGFVDWRGWAKNAGAA